MAPKKLDLPDINRGDDAEEWMGVAAAVQARLAELGYEPGERALARDSGVSEKTWLRIVGAYPLKRADRVRAVCEFLGWTYDSIQELRDGGTERLAPRPVATVDDKVEYLMTSVELLHQGLARVAEVQGVELPPLPPRPLD